MNQQMPGNPSLVLMSPTKRQLTQYLSSTPKNIRHFQICQCRWVFLKNCLFMNTVSLKYQVNYLICYERTPLNSKIKCSLITYLEVSEYISFEFLEVFIRLYYKKNTHTQRIRTKTNKILRGLKVNCHQLFMPQCELVYQLFFQCQAPEQFSFDWRRKMTG